MTIPSKDQPQFRGEPVILVHLAVDGTNIAWCAPFEFYHIVESYPNIPRILCPACQRKTRE